MVDRRIASTYSNVSNLWPVVSFVAFRNMTYNLCTIFADTKFSHCILTTRQNTDRCCLLAHNRIRAGSANGRVRFSNIKCYGLRLWTAMYDMFILHVLVHRLFKYTNANRLLNSGLLLSICMRESHCLCAAPPFSVSTDVYFYRIRGDSVCRKPPFHVPMYAGKCWFHITLCAAIM